MSCGPGDASGWPWKQNAGLSVRAKPCSVPSNSETCVGAQVRRQRGRVDREAVVLAGDHDLAGVEVLHRMVGAVVAELHLAASSRRTASAMIWWPRQMPNVGMPRVDELARRGDRVVARLRVARAVGQEDAVGLERAARRAPGVCAGTHGDLAAALGEHAQDVVLDAVVEGDDVDTSARPAGRSRAPSAHAAFGPLVGLGAR